MLHMPDLYGILSISAVSILFCNINCEESSVKVPSYQKMDIIVSCTSLK